MRCPECNKLLSDKAYSCPQCGHPIKKSEADNFFEGAQAGCLGYAAIIPAVFISVIVCNFLGIGKEGSIIITIIIAIVLAGGTWCLIDSKQDN